MTLAYSNELPFDCSACGKTAWCKLICQFSRVTKRKGDVNNQLAEHDRLTNHAIDWNSAQHLLFSTTESEKLVYRLP